MRLSSIHWVLFAMFFGGVGAGCVGQSGGPPTCAEPHHCLCTTDFSLFIRGTVIDDDAPRPPGAPPLYSGRFVQIRVDEVPFPEAYPTLSVGTIIGGMLDNGGCTTGPVYGVGTQVAVFNYDRGYNDSWDCPEQESCREVCATGMPITPAALPEYEACLDRECPASAREICRTYTADAWINGSLRIALEEGDALNFGSEPTGSARILLSDIASLGDLAMCDARLPPPPSRCLDDTP